MKILLFMNKLGYIYEKEYHFLIDIKRKRNSQIAWKQKIIRRIVKKTVVRKNTSQFI